MQLQATTDQSCYLPLQAYRDPPMYVLVWAEANKLEIRRNMNSALANKIM